ncbi:uncharacterized protein METZ01_LOCUS509432, partial [marine metagenome]
MNMINAIIPVWKPINWTSFDVVKKIRNQIKHSKVGHAGSLDPFAEGVLMLCTGKFTKKVESFMDKEKEYIATIKFGLETDTLDVTGKIVKTSKLPILSNNIILYVLKQFVGSLKQEPPMYSALKVNGHPLYKYARNGIQIHRKLRDIIIYDIQLIDYDYETMTIKIICGRGTYIRSLAKDIAIKL